MEDERPRVIQNILDAQQNLDDSTGVTFVSQVTDMASPEQRELWMARVCAFKDVDLSSELALLAPQLPSFEAGQLEGLMTRLLPVQDTHFELILRSLGPGLRAFMDEQLELLGKTVLGLISEMSRGEAYGGIGQALERFSEDLQADFARDTLNMTNPKAKALGLIGLAAAFKSSPIPYQGELIAACLQYSGEGTYRVRRAMAKVFDVLEPHVQRQLIKDILAMKIPGQQLESIVALGPHAGKILVSERKELMGLFFASRRLLQRNQCFSTWSQALGNLNDEEIERFMVAARVRGNENYGTYMVISLAANLLLLNQERQAEICSTIWALNDDHELKTHALAALAAGLEKGVRSRRERPV